MAPLIKDEDLVQIRRRPFYFPGDIVAFADDRGMQVCHRFLGYVYYRDRWRLVTNWADHRAGPAFKLNAWGENCRGRRHASWEGISHRLRS